MRTREVTARLSRLFGGAGAALPVLIFPHVPVQFDAAGVQTREGDSTTISMPAVTSAPWSAPSLSSSYTRLTRRKSPQGFCAWICETQRSTASAFGRDAAMRRPNTRFGSFLAAVIPAVISFNQFSRQSSDDGGSSESGTLSLPARLHLRSR